MAYQGDVWVDDPQTDGGDWFAQADSGPAPRSVDPAQISQGADFGGLTGGYTPTMANAPAGYDQTKWADPAHQTPKYIAGRIVAAGGSPQDVANALGAEYRGGDRIYRPDLGLVDVTRDYGPGGANAAFWNPISVDANGNPISYEQALAMERGGSAAGGGLNGGNFSYPSFNETYSAPAPYTPATFTPPTYADLANDEGFKAILDYGNKALQASAAAKGTLLTTGTVKDLQNQNRTLANSYYGDIYNRALNTFATNEGNRAAAYGTNATNSLNQYLQHFGQYQDARNAALGIQQSNFGQGLALDQNRLAWNQNAFGQGFNLAQLNSSNMNQAAGRDLAYAQMYPGIYANGAQAYSNLATGAGNAAAAGQVGSANAYGSAIGGSINDALNIYASSYPRH